MRQPCSAKRDGFIALGVVTCISFIAGLLVVASSLRVLDQGKGVIERHELSLLRFDAISCVHIARLKIFTKTVEIRGEYDTKNGTCKILEDEHHSNQIVIKTSSEIDRTKVIFESVIDSASYAILSIQEVD